MLQRLITAILFVMAATGCFLTSATAQQSLTETYTVKSDANAGELNSARLDHLTVEQQTTKERIVVVARLGRGETARSLNLQRLKAARLYLVKTKGINKEHVIFAEGEKIIGEGRLEFYLGGKLILISLAKRNQKVSLVCCTD